MPPSERWRPSRQWLCAAGRTQGPSRSPHTAKTDPAVWFRQVEGLMAFCNIMDDYFCVVLVQGALSHAQQDSVAGILEADPLPSNAYQLLKAELLRLHETGSGSGCTLIRLLFIVTFLPVILYITRLPS
jgi:hypothetical protein